MNDFSHSKNELSCVVKVSIVMAVFNAQKTISRAIESILSQTFSDWELVVVDDCSIDETSHILASYAGQDKRIKVLRNDQNSGLAVSLNKGLAVATAALIARMDGDDEMLPQRLEKQVSFMSEHPAVGVLGSGAYLVDENDHFLGLALQPETHSDILKTIKFRNPIMHPTVMMRSSLFLKQGYSSKLRKKQDYELWSRLIKQTLFHNLQEPLIRYSANYKKSILTIISGFYVSCLVAIRFRSCLGFAYAFVRLAVSMLIKTNIYTPTSIKQREVVVKSETG